MSDFAAGFGDVVTFGGTAAIRRAIGSDGVVDYGSGAYLGGGVTGAVAGAAVTGGATSAAMTAAGVTSTAARAGVQFGVQGALGVASRAGQDYTSGTRSTPGEYLVAGALGAAGEAASALRCTRETGFSPNTGRFAVDSAGEATMFVNQGSTALKVSSYAARRMTQREISIETVESTLSNSPFQYFHQGVWKTGYYDPAARIFVGAVDDTLATVIRDVSPNYIQNLRAAAP